MKTMDTMLASHKKYRPPLSAASFYQPDIYARPSTLRPQSEYRFAGGGTLTARARSAGGGSRRARLCSAALAVAALVAALAVLAVAALAFYMGALRPDNNDPIISFECSARVTRGDVYGGVPGSAAWRERARRYSAALRSIYSSAQPPIRAAFAGVHVTGFGDHRLDVYFRLYLDRRKIPSSVSNLEELLKDILVQDLQSKRPAFGQIKIDPTSIIIKRDLEHSYRSESYMKQAINESIMPSNFSNLSQASTKDKGGHTRVGVIRKTTIKPNQSNKKRVPTSNDEPEINTENLPVIQGTFQITKTEADITENNQSEGQTRNLEKITSKIPTTTTKSPTTRKVYTTTPRPKPFTIRSTMNVKTRMEASTTKRMDIFSKTSTATSTTTVRPSISITTSATATSSTIIVPKSTNQVSQLLLDLLTKENQAKDLPKIDTLFTVPHVIDDEPWRPITKPSSMYNDVTSANPNESISPSTKDILPSKYIPDSLVSHNTEDSLVNQDAEDRIGVAEVVEDLTAIEGMINTYPTINSEIKTSHQQSFPGIHNSDPNLAADIYIPKPVYTSFTHPTISPTVKDTETLGLNYPKAHPIPVDIIGSVIESYSPNYPQFMEDDGKPIMRPPKDKVSTISINVMPLDGQPESVNIAEKEMMTNKTNELKLNTGIVEVVESKSEDNGSDENTERYFKTDPTKKTTPVPPNNLTATTSTPHFTWELVNSSTKGNENLNKNSIAKYFNDTLQAIISKNYAPFPNTTPKFPSRMSLLKNITEIIKRFTTTTHDKNKQQPNPELRNDENGPSMDDDPLPEVITSSTNASPIITLMPAKSNLGINRPLRPRPKNPNYKTNDREDVRSFSHKFEPINIREIKDIQQQIKFQENDNAQHSEHVTDPFNSENLSDSTDSSIEIITSANFKEIDEKSDKFFLTNVSDTIKVTEESAYTDTKNKYQDSLRLPKTNTEFEAEEKFTEILQSDENYEGTKNSETIYENHTEPFVTDSPEENATENINNSEDFYHADNLDNTEYFTNPSTEESATSIPEGTFKISYHVSGSVSSKTSTRTKSLPTYDLPLDPDIVLEIPVNQTSQLSAEKLRQLANLATISDALNNSYIQVENSPDEDVISHKAVSSSYTVNHAGFKILTKTYNKSPITKDDEKNFNTFHADVSNKGDNKKIAIPNKKDECNATLSFRCNSGQCLPLTSKCNRLLDCPGGEDENTCTCSDYLRSEFLLSKICDGIVDCWDFSDENTCEWCSPDQFVCANARQCIERERVCDGTPDCPLGDDERTCVTLADNFEDNAVVPYNEEGYLMVRKHGVWGRLCVQNFQKVIVKARSTLQLDDLGRAVCKSMTFEESNWVREARELRQLDDLEEKEAVSSGRRYWEVWHNSRPRAGETRLSFRRAACPRRRALRVRCASLECGLRPFADTQQARIVGGAGSTGGAWPWQAALYRDGDFQCGATLIAPDWLISASHCFYQATEAHWVARLGALRRGAWPRGPWEITTPVTKVHLHPRYVARGFRNDIALLRVPRLRMHARLRPVCLPPPNTEPPPGTLCTVVGWGQLYELGRVFPDTLQEVELPVISTAECKRRTLFLPLYKVTDDMFCAGYERGGRDACLGDSGGPLMCQEADNRWYLHGVTSNGYGCARANRPGVYTKVSNYMEWIDSVMQQYVDEDQTDVSSSSPQTNKTDSSDLDVAENRRVSRLDDTCKGHRCPLGECLPPSSVCNGFLECSDGSDEQHCHHKT